MRLEAGAVALGLLGVWSVYWLAFYPAVIGWDPLAQLAQIESGKYTDWHPAFHTLLLALFYKVFESVAALAFCQMLAAAALYFLAYCQLSALGAPRWSLLAMAAWLALSPAFGYELIAIWKDTPFALGTLALVGLLLRFSQGGPINRWLFVALVVLCVWIASIRHNGVFLVAALLVGCLALDQKHRKAYAISVAVFCAAFPLVRFAALAAIDAPPIHRSLLQQVVLHHTAAVLADPAAEVSPATLASLESVMPRREWAERYDCTTAREIMYEAGMTNRELPSTARAIGTWLRLAVRNPGTALGHWACVTRHLWSLTEPVTIGPVAVGPSIIANEGYYAALGLRTESLWLGANRWLSHVIRSTNDNAFWRGLVWSPALPLFSTLCLVALACRRQRSSWPLLVMLPVLLNSAIWFGLASFPHIRFQFPLLLAAPLALPLAALPLAARQDSDAEPAGHE